MEVSDIFRFVAWFLNIYVLLHQVCVLEIPINKLKKKNIFFVADRAKYGF